ncbi:MAG: ABC transporter permease [Zunongwangia sp.]|jgi:putative ABC transport system permease protein|uniref:FtsX family membrane protein n=2 Tax=Zunongwangia profunda TaxID=398743 RepID=D5BFL8_ZUNPS|nr:ABC transporter permease [Zunongwangia profunda]MAO34408.1 ABC transporter permease [Zunongwangia sp.]ADF50962.1 FtsX family membrane protein [Zunongwangia profunda SM-A87]MAS72522.1 ABC transporter permease [Zunongwangia sp.]MCC4227264.1 ABC transporter permease [Zunongwangia profunda]HAJ82142.1 ABC transporter permease [Zunongwangia profunda]|tara:strand:- start:1069 stop:2334 length:1266 start_codon:yes stop_codon:yes gene_type:complete
MFSRDRWDEIIEALTANWFRTLLTAFGVLWGIFILVILLAAGKGLENGVKQGFSGMATNSMFMWSQTVSKPYKGLPKGRNYNFKLGDVQAIKQTVTGLEIVSPRNQLGGFGGANNVVRGLNSGAYNVYGDYPEIIRQQPMDITSGRFINYSDIKDNRKVAVIGEGVRAGLYDINEEALGTYIKINGVSFMVIGTYKKKGSGGGNVEEMQKEIFVPFTAFSQAFNMGNVVGWMAITADDDHSITNLKNSVFDVIKSRHSIAPDDDRAVGNFDLYEEYSRINGLFIALRLVAYFVGTLVLLSGIIGISNIMLIVVKERTNEIGIRRALGASPWNIRGQILLESIFLTIISGMAGIILSTFVIFIINMILDGMDTSEMMFINPSVNIGVVLIALAILVISGLLAGLIPAQNAIKIKPVDALRTE